MSAPVIADNLSRSFDDTRVVRDLSITVEEGEIYGFIGPSGSGKTTTLRMMTGVLAPSEGSVTVFGTDPTKLGTADRQRIGYMPQLGVLYPELTIADNLRFVASLYGVRKPKDRMKEVLEMLEMGDTQTLRLENASGGMQRRVALAAALMHDPQLLFLDEPTTGLDPVLRRRVWEHLGDLRDQGRTVFVTTQIVSEAASCDSVCLIADGSLLAQGTPDELRRMAHDGEVIDLYLAQPVTEPTLEVLRGHDAVRDVQVDESDTRVVRVTADAADVAIEELTPFLANRDIELRLAERHVAPFDDVFVLLLERTRG